MQSKVQIFVSITNWLPKKFQLNSKDINAEAKLVIEQIEGIKSPLIAVKKTILGDTSAPMFGCPTIFFHPKKEINGAEIDKIFDKIESEIKRIKQRLKCQNIGIKIKIEHLKENEI